MNKIKICHIQLAYYPGIGNTDIYEYTKSLAKFNYDVSVIVAGRENEKINNFINNINVQRLRFSSVNKSFFNSLRFYLYVIKKYKKFIENNNFDIIHIYSSFGCFLLPFIFHKKNIKWIYDIRSGAISGGLKSFFSKFIQKFETIFFNITIVLDDALGYDIFKKNKKNIFTVPLGANFNLFKQKRNNLIREKYKIKKNEFLIIQIGSINPTRKLHQIIWGFKKVLEENNKLKLMFIGDGPDIDNIKNLTKELHLQNKIIFAGLIDYEKIPDYINSADIGISYVPITPEYNVQPPLKTVEYMACGLPTIATNTLGNRRFIKNGFNGLLVKDNPDDLAKAIIRLVGDKKLRDKITKNSRNSVKEYDWENIVKKKLIPVYNKKLVS